MCSNQLFSLDFNGVKFSITLTSTVLFLLEYSWISPVDAKAKETFLWYSRLNKSFIPTQVISVERLQLSGKYQINAKMGRHLAYNLN